MKRIYCFILTCALCLSLCACGGGKNVGNKIPDVFGISYTDAIMILEAEGYEVTAIETNVDNISTKLQYPLKKVDKGTVFKIDDYILDNLGHLNKNYNVFYDGELVSEDKSVVIYYAKENYILEKNKVSNATSSTTETSKIDLSAQTPNTTEKEPDNDASNNGSLNPNFKAAMDSYENFMDEYVAFMKKYKANPGDLNLLADYTDYMSKYTDFVEDFEKWEDEDMNDAETAYYIGIQSRVSKKLLEVAN